MSQLQYAALTDANCPTAATKMRLPQVAVSWVQAVEAADKYNLWLRKNAAGKFAQGRWCARLPAPAD